jgi:exopolysaccharide biosynthesis polyprenyl glycosylphosphotransferase
VSFSNESARQSGDTTIPPPDGRFGRFGRSAVRARGLPIAEAPAQQDVRLRDGHYRRALALADATVAGWVLLLMSLIDGTTAFEPIVLVAMPLIVVVNKLAGLYERDELVLNKTTLDEAPALLQLSGLFALIVWLAHSKVMEVWLGPKQVLLLWGATCVGLILARAAARRLARGWSTPERCLMIGESDSVDTVREKFRAGRGVKAELIASLRPGECGRLVMDQPDALKTLVRQQDVHRLIIAPGGTGTEGVDMLEVVGSAKAAGVRVSILPRLFEVVGSSVEFDHFDGLTMLGVRRFGLTRSSRTLKRAFDLVGSSLLLVSVAPLLAVIAAAIRLDSRGPVFFRQVRVGRDGERFEMLKFRTMAPDAEAQKDRLRHLNEARGLFKIADDPRVTRVGRFLRSTSLDELPQLLNVWRGEMSLVGPRPLVVDEDSRVQGLYRSRLYLTPGMTGHWQILGSARIPMEEMVGIDYLCIANWSLWTDLKILLRTIPHVLVRGGM